VADHGHDMAGRLQRPHGGQLLLRPDPAQDVGGSQDAADRRFVVTEFGRVT